MAWPSLPLFVGCGQALNRANGAWVLASSLGSADLVEGGGWGWWAFARKNVGRPRKYVTSLHSVYRILGYFCSNQRFDCLNCLNLMFRFPGLLEHGLLEIGDADLCEVKKVSTLQIIGVNGVNAVSGKPSKKLKGKASKASKAGSSDSLFGRSAHRSLNKWIQMGGLRGIHGSYSTGSLGRHRFQLRPLRLAPWESSQSSSK